MISKKKKRQLEIEDYIQLKNKVTLDELAEKFNVNRITIHRDLSDLEEGGKIRKVISGACCQQVTFRYLQCILQ
ncbi:MAG: DeoR family transcriptional regulator [Actinobacteria bacterium]|nr:DeoR family transcriptional regulator [Actinomycetota bacterium]